MAVPSARPAGLPMVPESTPELTLNRLLLAVLATLPFTAQGSGALAKTHGCTACHAAASQLVGPAFRAVAEKYAGQPDAAAALARKIRAGGAGVWGDMAMPPQPGVPEADARKLAVWVLAGAK